MRDEVCYVKKCPLKGKQATWLSLLEGSVIRGAIFCGGIGSLLITESYESCLTLPEDENLVAVAIDCLRHLKEKGSIPRNYRKADYQTTASRRTLTQS